MVSTDRIQNELGFKSKWTFEEGIQKTVNWYLENYR
jgi:nucleoside-diphosphate-sugar epimerase